MEVWFVFSGNFYWLPIIQLGGGGGGGKKAILYVIRQRVQEKSDNRALVKGATSSNTAYRFQAVHKLADHPFSDPYPAHFDHVFFFSEQQGTCLCQDFASCLVVFLTL